MLAMYLKRRIFVLFFMMSFKLTSAQSTNQFYSIVVEVPSFSEGKTIPLWKDALDSIDGVTLQKYCPAQGWLVLSVDDAIIPTSTDPETILRNANLQGIIKYGATGAQVEANCHGAIKYLNKRSHH
jgi:hypothetical protein